MNIEIVINEATLEALIAKRKENRIQRRALDQECDDLNTQIDVVTGMLQQKAEEEDKAA